jgi:hypothetical protein
MSIQKFHESALQSSLIVLHREMQKQWPGEIQLQISQNGLLATASGFGVKGMNVSNGNPLADALIRLSKKVLK